MFELGLELSNVHDEPGQAYFEVWMPPGLDDASVVHYVDDAPIGLRYLFVDGEPAWEKRVRQCFPVMPEADALARAHSARTDVERIDATFMVAVAESDAPSADALAVLRASLHHPSEDVRHSALLASGYLRSSNLEEDVKLLASSDPSHRVRGRARRLLDVVAARGWGQ